MPLDNTKLLDFLGEIDKKLSCKIVLVAVGGTAMEAKTPYPPDSSIWEPNGLDPDTCPVPACRPDDMHGNAQVATPIFKIHQDA